MAGKMENKIYYNYKGWTTTYASLELWKNFSIALDANAFKATPHSTVGVH